MIRYSITVMHTSIATGGKAGYHIRRCSYVVCLKALCTVQVRTLTSSSASGLLVIYVRTLCYDIHVGTSTYVELGYYAM